MVWVSRVEERELGVLALVFADFVFELGRVGRAGDEVRGAVDDGCIPHQHKGVVLANRKIDEEE